MSKEDFQLVRLPNDAWSIRSLRTGETMHPGVGPEAEAQAVYLDQLNLPARLGRATPSFMLWDVGLGAGGNVLHLFARTADAPGNASLEAVSFDRNTDALAFALKHADRLPWVRPFQDEIRSVMATGRARFRCGRRSVDWRFVGCDFPVWLESTAARTCAAPEAVFYDAWSPARNPSMWTLRLFQGLFQRVEPGQTCTLATYSRATSVRVALLLAGFHVGRGRTIGVKEETTVASTDPALLDDPLGTDWLRRARISSAAEPLEGDCYRQAPLSPESWEALRLHPQFVRH